MKLLNTILLAGQLLLPAASAVHTGFAYGAFWSESEPKFKKDFLRQFNLAKNLPGLPMPFNSARLFQTAQWMSGTEPSEAFEAAIETNTTLLLGLWLGSLDQELAALDNAFEKHGQKLADLVVGISVGNEDIYRSSPVCKKVEGEHGCGSAFTKEQVIAQIRNVTALWQEKPWWKRFKTPPPIGHTDIAAEAGLPGLGFTGATLYPFWDGKSIEDANGTLFGSLAGVQERADQTPVWITETGWPASGTANGAADPTVDNMQKFWTDVGCSLFGKYNVWWFELERDTSGASNKFDWGIIDIASQKPKIKDLSCPQISKVDPPADTAPSSQPPPETLSAPEPSPSAPSEASPSSSVSSPPPAAPTDPLPPPPPIPTSEVTSAPASPSAPDPEVVFMTTTVVVTVPVDAPAEASVPIANDANSSASAPAIAASTQPTGCITVANVNGTYVSVASNPPDSNGACATPPPYPGPEYVKQDSQPVSSTVMLNSTEPSESSLPTYERHVRRYGN